MAFTSGLTLTVNNFVVKETKTDFGEIMAVRGLFQIPAMLIIIAIQGFEHNTIGRSIKKSLIINRPFGKDLPWNNVPPTDGLLGWIVWSPDDDDNLRLCQIHAGNNY